MIAKIKKIIAQEILNSRGLPTIEVRIFSNQGLSSQASVPGGSSSGDYEAWDLRDGDQHRYQGQGVLKAVKKIKEIIAPALEGQKVENQLVIDQILIDLDGTKHKNKLGANTLLAVSIAVARLAAQTKKQELFVYLKESFSLGEPKIPRPLFDIFNGGKHADTNLDFQEFLLIPKKLKAREMVRMGAEIFKELGVVLHESGYDTDTGEEGGYAPNLDSSLEALDFMLAASLRAGYQPGQDVYLGIDVGSSVLYEADKKKYLFSLDQAYFSSDNLIGLYHQWLKDYPLIYLEDGLAADDLDAWQELTTELGKKILIAGDELFATNIDRLRLGLQKKLANSIIIKPNQTGTVSETIACIKLAQKHNYKVIISQRGAETNDDFITDLAVAVAADFLKAGSLSRGERVAKYNRLITIENSLDTLSL